EGVFQVRVSAEISQRVVDARAADNREAVDVLEIGAHRFGDAGPNPVVGGLARDVGEGHHRHGLLDGSGDRGGGPAGSQKPRAVPLSTNFARPKSRTFTRPRSVRIRLALLMSRWTIPRECASSRASAT